MKIHAFLLILTLLSTSCSSTKKLLTEKEARDKVQDPSSYDSEDDYLISDKNHFTEFLDKYYPRLAAEKLTGLDTKEKMLANFNTKTTLPRGFFEWALQNLERYNTTFSIQLEFSTFNFHYYDRKKPRTLVYMHENLSPSIYLWDFALDLAGYFPEYNIVIVDNYKVNRSEKIYDTHTLNKNFIADFRSFKKASNTEQQIFDFNIVCHSTLLTYEFFNQNHEEYNNVIYYSPMVKKDKDDVVINFSTFMKPSETLSFSELIYFYTIPSGRTSRGYITPRVSNQFNIQTEMNIVNTYFEGIDISKVKNKFLIYSEKERILTLKSYDHKAFQDKNIQVLKNMGHSDYYAIKDKRHEYFKALSLALKN